MRDRHSNAPCDAWASLFCSATKSDGRMVWKSTPSASWICASKKAAACKKEMFRECSNSGFVAADHMPARKARASSFRVVNRICRRVVATTGTLETDEFASW